MSDMGIFSPEATRRTLTATVEPVGPAPYINKYGSRVVEDEDVVLPRAIRGMYQQIEAEVDRLTRISNQLEREASQAGIVGSELGSDYIRLNAGLEYLVDQLNNQGASIRGEQVTVAGLIAPDAKIRVENAQIGNFRIEGVRTFRDGQDLLEEVSLQDRTLYFTATGNSGIGIDGLPTAFEALTSSIEERPEIEAAMQESLQEVEALNAEIDRLQADADVLRASISEVDTGGKQPDPATPEAQMALLDEMLRRYGGDDRFDLTRPSQRLERAKAFLAPAVEAVSEYASPEARTARNVRATVTPAPARPPTEDARTAIGTFQAAQETAGPVSRPPTEDGRTVAAETVSPEVGQARRIGPTPSGGAAGAAVPGADGVVPTGGGGSGVTRLSAAQIRDANQAEVEALLAQQFGGFSFFLQKHRSDLQVGLTADGQVVAADDPNAASVKNILDVIVDQGITAPTRVLGLLENTEWWQKTDAKMREYDVLTADMSEPQKTEYLEPVLDLLREEAQFLGFQLDSGRARDLAEQITRMGEENDAEYIRGLLTAEESFNAAEVTASSFAAARDEIVAMSKRYFTPINEADAAQFAQDIYVGTKTTEGVEQYFREMAANKFPQLQNSLDAGITPEQYFAPYKYEIERMLDRPNVDLYEEFGDVIQYIPDTGTGEARPMTLGEVRKYVRGLDEWQQSSQGKDSARALAFSIGRVFGEVA